MTDRSTPPILAIYAVVARWARQEGMQPRTLWKGETDEWAVIFNGTARTIDGVPAGNFVLRHMEYLCFAIFSPVGGIATGRSEDDITRHFNALLNEPISDPSIDFLQSNQEPSNEHTIH